MRYLKMLFAALLLLALPVMAHAADPSIFDVGKRSSFAVGLDRQFRPVGVTETQAWVAKALVSYALTAPDADHPAMPRLALSISAEQPFDSNEGTKFNLGIRWILKKAGN